MIPFQPDDKAVYHGEDSPFLRRGSEMTVTRLAPDHVHPIEVAVSGERKPRMMLPRQAEFLRRPPGFYPGGIEGVAQAVRELGVAEPVRATPDLCADLCYYLRDADGGYHWLNLGQSAIRHVDPDIGDLLFARSETVSTVGVRSL